MTRHCGNPACAKPLERKPREANHKFRNRLYCDSACSGAAQTHKAQVRNLAASKPCANPRCTTRVVKHRHEKPARFAIRHCCSHRCYGEWVKSKTAAACANDSKPCEGCKKPFHRRTNEGPKKFEARLCCSPECARHVRRKVDTFRIGGLSKVEVGGKKGFVPPPRPGTHFESPEEWLKRNKPTRLPTRYVAPVTGA